MTKNAPILSSKYQDNACPITKNDTRACFPETSLIETQHDGFKLISKLKYGDMVKTIDLATNKIIFSKFVFYLHKEENTLAYFIQITTNKNKILKISEKHLISKMNTATNRIDYVFAKDLNHSDLIVISQNGMINYEEVVKIEQVEEMGIYAPLTESGTIIVDNILASCYAHVDNHELAHFAFKLYFFMRNIYEIVFNRLNNESYQTGLHWYADFLIKFSPFSL